MTRACAGALVALWVGCADTEPVRERSPSAPPDPIAAELADSVVRPRELQPTPEELNAACADPARACALYQALREGRAVIELERGGSGAEEPCAVSAPR